jgi:hypothetical protein
MFDQDRPRAREHAKVQRVFRGVDDPNEVFIALEFESLDIRDVVASRRGSVLHRLRPAFSVGRERAMRAHLAAGYHRAMLLRPLRRAPMMLGGVGFQAGLDEVRRKQIESQRQAIHAAAAPAPNVVEQLKDLKALLDDGVLSPEEFQVAKRKVLGG